MTNALSIDFRDPETVFEDLTISEEIQRELLSNIRRRLTPQPTKIRAGKS